MKSRAVLAPGIVGAALGCSALASGAGAAPETLTWAAWTASPQPIDPAGHPASGDGDAELLARCGHGEAGLRVAAEQLVRQRLGGSAPLDLDALTFALRAAGEPHVWPHAWVSSGHALDRGATLAALGAWGKTFRDGGERRCGVATGKAKDGTEVVAAVAVDALADLAPFPTTAHVGMFITLDARILVPIAEPRVVVQGPGAEPRSVPTWTETEDGVTHVRARLLAERPGAFTVQVVGEADAGPRPLLEARLFADAAPPAHFEPSAAPGEDAQPAPGNGEPPSPNDALAAMLSRMRAAEALPPFTRDPRLDALALAHARRMLATRTVGHDVGDGDPEQRVLSTGARARVVGENVAHAASVRLAHRAIYESPSHRANLLRDDFDRVGVAVVEGADGSVWVTELFAAGLRY